jgi:transposase
MRCLLAQIDLLEEQENAVKTAIEVVMAEIPLYITTSDGIGLVTGAALLAEIGDVHRFETLEKRVAFAGI